MKLKAVMRCAQIVTVFTCVMNALANIGSWNSPQICKTVRHEIPLVRHLGQAYVCSIRSDQSGNPLVAAGRNYQSTDIHSNKVPFTTKARRFLCARDASFGFQIRATVPSCAPTSFMLQQQNATNERTPKYGQQKKKCARCVSKCCILGIEYNSNKKNIQSVF